MRFLPVKLSAFSRHISLGEAAWATPERAIAAANIKAMLINIKMRLISSPRVSWRSPLDHQIRYRKALSDSTGRTDEQDLALFEQDLALFRKDSRRSCVQRSANFSERREAEVRATR